MTAVERSTGGSKDDIMEFSDEDKNKLVFLLDELLRQEALNRDEYIKLNTMLAETIDEEMDFNAEDEVDGV